MLKRLCALVLVLLSVFGAAGCGKQASLEAGISLIDDTGKQLTVPQAPQKVAVLFSSFADIWVIAGGEVAITVGESVERGFADADALLVDDGAGKSIDVEALLTAEPDLVICSADIEAQYDTAQICNEAGIPAAAFVVESFEDYLRVLQVFTQITGQEENYKTYGTDLLAEIEKIRDTNKALAADKTFLFIRASSSAKSTKAKLAEDHFACAMIQEFGAYNIAENAPVLLDGLSFEEVLTQDPDYIFISIMGEETAVRAYMDDLLSQPAWQSLSAVKNGAVQYLPKELFQYKPNAQWAQAYLYLLEVMEG